MAEWKRLIVSGSDAELNSLTLDTQLQVGAEQIITTDGVTTFLTGSFSGSFSGDGSGITGISADYAITEGRGIVPFTYDGSSAQTVEVSGSTELSDNTLVMWDNTDGKFVDSLISQNSGDVIIDATGEIDITSPDGLYINVGTSAVEITGDLNVNGSVTANEFSGSFSGSFQGDGSGLTGLVTTLSGSTDTGDFEVDLLTQTLTVQGTANQIETSATGQTITVGLSDNVTIEQNLTVGGDLIVQGDVTEIQTTNLLVEDRYILLNSGSIGGVAKGGIVVDSGGGTGKAIILGEASGRWGFTGSLAHNSTTATPDAFAAAVVTSDIAEYRQSGNIRVEAGDIYIWA